MRRLGIEEIGTDEEGLSEAVGRGLRGVFELQTPLRPVAEQTLEPGTILGRGDD